MKAEKILNNNVVVILDENSHERIIMGAGIGFQKKPGDFIDENKIDKQFYLSNSEVNTQLLELLNEIPSEYIELTEDIIAYTKNKIGKDLNDNIYVSLVDHIFTAVKRHKEGIDVHNKLLWEVKRFYPDEYLVGIHSLDMIEDVIGVRLIDDEAAFIAMHVVNAEANDTVDGVYEITKIMQEISNIVRYYFNVEFDEESVYYFRFVSHLKFFAQRLVSGKTYANEENDDLLLVIKEKYKNAYSCVQKIEEYLFEKYNYILTSEEKLYLTIHIERIVYKTSE